MNSHYSEFVEYDCRLSPILRSSDAASVSYSMSSQKFQSNCNGSVPKLQRELLSSISEFLTLKHFKSADFPRSTSIQNYSHPAFSFLTTRYFELIECKCRLFKRHCNLVRNFVTYKNYTDPPSSEAEFNKRIDLFTELGHLCIANLCVFSGGTYKLNGFGLFNTGPALLMSQNGKLSIVSSNLNALLATITNYANSLYEIDDGALLDKFVNVLRHHCNEYLADYTDPKTWGYRKEIVGLTWNCSICIDDGNFSEISTSTHDGKNLDELAVYEEHFLCHGLRHGRPSLGEFPPSIAQQLQQQPQFQAIPSISSLFHRHLITLFKPSEMLNPLRFMVAGQGLDQIPQQANEPTLLAGADDS